MTTCRNLDFVECPNEIKAHDTHPGKHGHVAEVAKEAKDLAVSATSCCIEHTEKEEMNKDCRNYVGHNNLAIHAGILFSDDINSQSDEETEEADT